MLRVVVGLILDCCFADFSAFSLVVVVGFLCAQPFFCLFFGFCFWFALWFGGCLVVVVVVGAVFDVGCGWLWISRRPLLELNYLCWAFLKKNICFFGCCSWSLVCATSLAGCVLVFVFGLVVFWVFLLLKRLAFFHVGSCRRDGLRRKNLLGCSVYPTGFLLVYC